MKRAEGHRSCPSEGQVNCKEYDSLRSNLWRPAFATALLFVFVAIAGRAGGLLAEPAMSETALPAKRWAWAMGKEIVYYFLYIISIGYKKKPLKEI
jgi:hypothetical protein